MYGYQVWSHKEFPLMEVGRMVLNRNPANYFAEVEQLAFAPGKEKTQIIIIIIQPPIY